MSPAPADASTTPPPPHITDPVKLEKAFDLLRPIFCYSDAERESAFLALQAAGAISFTSHKGTSELSIKILDMEILQATITHYTSPKPAITDAHSPHNTNPVELEKARTLLTPFFDFVTIPHWSETSVRDGAILTRKGIVTWEDDSKKQKEYAQAIRDEKLSRVDWLSGLGAISYTTNDQPLLVGGHYLVKILDMEKLTAAVASYPYTNPAFPKPNVVETASIEHGDHLVRKPGAAVTD
jgi:hypothetical protein